MTQIKRQSLPCNLGLRVMAVALASALTGACAVGPDFHRPAAPLATGFAPQPMPATTASAPNIPGGDAVRFVIGRDIPFAWWQELGSPKLDALVARALVNSPTLTAAIAVLRQAHEQTAAQRGFFYPTVTPEFGASRQQIAGNLAGNDPGIQGNGTNLTAPPGHPLVYSFYTAQVGLSYTPDVFGGNRRQLESLKAQEENLRFQMEAAYITLTTNVVAAALQEASLQAQIKATQAYIETSNRAMAILRDQQRAGLAMRLDVAQQEGALAQAEALLPPLHKQLEQNHDLIRALLGGLPSDDVDLTFDLDGFRLPHELPLSLPAQLIDQRPDVRAAEANLHVASAEVGVAVAARLPNLAITGAYGGAASSIGQLFQPGAAFWSIVGNTTAVLFDGGTLRHRQHAAQQGLIVARAQYRSTVINAFQNVADTLHAIQADADALAAAAHAEAATKAARDVTRDQFRVGYVNYQTLLIAEGTYQQSVVTRVQAQTNRFGDAAALFQALGGGWWNRTAGQDKLAADAG